MPTWATGVTPPLANSFNLNLSAANLNVDVDSAGLRGVTNVTGIDGDGKPYRSSITLDDNAAGNGWYFDSTPDDHAEFTDLVTRYSANKPGSDYDFYRTTLHEIGHAMGVASNADLAIWDFMELAGADQQENDDDVYLLTAGATTATLTTKGGLHVYEGPPANAGDPVNPNDLMNPGRDVTLDPINRRLISDLDAKILRDVYLYRVTLPSHERDLPGQLQRDDGGAHDQRRARHGRAWTGHGPRHLHRQPRTV